MDTGTVFKWTNYLKQIDMKTKDRWFVYLGTSSILSEPLTFLSFQLQVKKSSMNPGIRERIIRIL